VIEFVKEYNKQCFPFTFTAIYKYLFNYDKIRYNTIKMIVNSITANLSLVLPEKR